MARDRRNRQLAGIPSDYDRVASGPSEEAILWLRDQGLKWSQVEGLVGFERVSLQRMLDPAKKNVSRSTERILLDAVKRVKANPKLLTRDALLLPAAWTRWQISALLARGWMGDFIEAKTGVTTPRKGDKVQRKVADAIDAFFLEHHTEWGPTRRTAVQMWRKGVFPADCYLWEERDIRPIPGSLRPELVSEALTYTAQHVGSADATRALLRKKGQWPKPICARTSMRHWNEFMGLPDEDYDEEPPTASWVKGRSPWCADTRHDHSLPVYWQAGGVTVNPPR